MGQHTLSGTQQPMRGRCAIAARIPSRLAIPFPLSIPPNETAIKEKEFGSKKIFLFPIFFSFGFLPTSTAVTVKFKRIKKSISRGTEYEFNFCSHLRHFVSSDGDGSLLYTAMPSCSLSLALYASALLLPWLIDWRAFVPPPGVLFNHNKVLTQTGADGNSKENTDDVMSAEEREWRERKNRINAREKRDRIEREERHLQISNDAKRSATHKNSARSSSLKKMHDQERREFKRRAFVNPGEMKASSYRYLRYENCPTNGINHQYANLLAMIEDAVMLDRIAVIPKVPKITYEFGLRIARTDCSLSISRDRLSPLHLSAHACTTLTS